MKIVGSRLVARPKENTMWRAKASSRLCAGGVRCVALTSGIAAGGSLSLLRGAPGAAGRLRRSAPLLGRPAHTAAAATAPLPKEGGARWGRVLAVTATAAVVGGWSWGHHRPNHDDDDDDDGVQLPAYVDRATRFTRAAATVPPLFLCFVVWFGGALRLGCGRHRCATRHTSRVARGMVVPTRVGNVCRAGGGDSPGLQVEPPRTRGGGAAAAIASRARAVRTPLPPFPPRMARCGVPTTTTTTGRPIGCCGYSSRTRAST
jgi:hypothetical protein